MMMMMSSNQQQQQQQQQRRRRRQNNNSMQKIQPPPGGLEFCGNIIKSPPEYDLLLTAAKKNDCNKMETLITSGVPPSHANGIGQTALHVAAIWGNLEAIQFLLKQDNINVNAANSLMGATPLHTIVHSSKTPSPDIQYNIIAMLLEAGADPGMEDYGKKAPINYLDPNHPHHSKLTQMLKRPPKDYTKIFIHDAMSGIGSGCVCCPPPPPKR